MPTASLPRDCGAWEQDTVPRLGFSRTLVSFPLPSPTHKPSPPHPAPSNLCCRKRTAVRAGGTVQTACQNALGLPAGVPQDPCSAAPSSNAASHPFTCAVPISPALRAHWENSAAPLGFLHLWGGPYVRAFAWSSLLPLILPYRC